MAPVKSASETTSRSGLGSENTMYLFLWRLARVESVEAVDTRVSQQASSPATLISPLYFERLK